MSRNSSAFSANDRVLHSVFGLGTILAANSFYTTIAFDESGTKKFVASLVRLERSDSEAPNRASRKKKVKAAK